MDDAMRCWEARQCSQSLMYGPHLITLTSIFEC